MITQIYNPKYPGKLCINVLSPNSNSLQPQTELTNLHLNKPHFKNLPQAIILMPQNSGADNLGPILR